MVYQVLHVFSNFVYSHNCVLMMMFYPHSQLQPEGFLSKDGLDLPWMSEAHLQYLHLETVDIYIMICYKVC